MATIDPRRGRQLAETKRRLAELDRERGCVHKRLEILVPALRRITPTLVVLHGGMDAKKRREAGATLKECPDGEPCVVLATDRFVGEGFDDPRLDTLSWRFRSPGRAL